MTNRVNEANHALLNGPVEKSKAATARVVPLNARTMAVIDAVRNTIEARIMLDRTLYLTSGQSGPLFKEAQSTAFIFVAMDLDGQTAHHFVGTVLNCRIPHINFYRQLYPANDIRVFEITHEGASLLGATDYPSWNSLDMKVEGTD